MGARNLGDYPRNLGQFRRRFPDDEACLRYLVETRWPDGFRCPACGAELAWFLERRRLWQCRACRHQSSVTAGTVLHRSRVPLSDWFTAAYLVASLKPGVSALQLAQQLGVHYETAWLMLHKLRRAMVNPGRGRLSGEVEVDETWIGGRQAGLTGGRQRAGRKALLVAGAVEVRTKPLLPNGKTPPHPTWLGRLRLEVIPDTSQVTLSGFIGRSVEPGATIISDAWTGYGGLVGLGFTHRPLSERAMRRAGLDADAVPGVHRVFSNLKDLAAWYPPWRRGRSPRPLPQRVRVPLQPPLLPDGRLCHPPRAHRGPAANHDRRDPLAAGAGRDEPPPGSEHRPHDPSLLPSDRDEPDARDRRRSPDRHPGRSIGLTTTCCGRRTCPDKHGRRYLADESLALVLRELDADDHKEVKQLPAA